MSHAGIWVLVLMLAIAAIYGTPSSMNVDGMRGVAESGAIVSSANGLILNRDTYQQLNRTPLPVADWQAQLRTTGTPLPRNGGFTWSYGLTAGTGHYFCLRSLHGTSLHVHQTLLKAQDRLQFDTYLAENCGATADMAAGTDISTLSALSLTIYTGS